MANTDNKTEPVVKKESVTTTKKPVVKKESVTTTKKPVVKKESVTATKKPAVKKESVTATKKPIVKKESAATTKKPVVKKMRPTITKSVADKETDSTKPIDSSTEKKDIVVTNDINPAETQKVAKKKIAKSVPSKKPSKDKVAKSDINTEVDSEKKAEPSMKKNIDSKIKKAPKKRSAKKFLPEEDAVKSNHKKGKLFYLLLALGFYAIAFFYINNILYDNQDYLKSALFAFATLFVFFVLLQFNIHMIFINFFRLPFKLLLAQTKVEIKQKSKSSKDKVKTKFSFQKYKAIFTLSLYALIALLLIGSQIYNGVVDGDKILIIITQSSLTLLVFLIIVCSWQYLFNILPGVLDKSIDAKNGFILTLSAAVMIIFVIFNIFDITYLAEMMIFVLVVGFVALLGVNLNMIVGEINIFQNLKKKHSSEVTKIVFLIFFAFHLYTILYASVVAFSIYQWEPEAYNFSADAQECIQYIGVYPNEEIVNVCEHDYGDFLYYSVVTVSTLGYGDITPSTDYGIALVWGGFLSLYGFMFFALSISFVSNIAIEGTTSAREEDKND